MTLTSTPSGFWFPTLEIPIADSPMPTTGMDATGKRAAMIGQIRWATGPGSTKTVNSSSVIHFIPGFWILNTGTTVVIGIQDVATGSGPVARPDDAFDVWVTCDSTTAGIATAVPSSVTLTTGTKDLADGDMIAVVWDMTNAAGSDLVTIRGQQGLVDITFGRGLPVTNSRTSGAWQITQTEGAGFTPNVIIIASDGTIGWLASMPASHTRSTITFKGADSPNEYGMFFQVPWDCEFDAFRMWGGVTDANSDFTFKSYADPTGTPTALTNGTKAMLAENMGGAGVDYFIEGRLASRVALTKTTNYLVSVLATGSSNVRLRQYTLFDTAHRVMIPGTTTVGKGTRAGSSGAFSAESPAVTMFGLAIRICSWHDTASAGGSGARVIGC